ncbi:MAG: peptidoglycan editing factor PgeF [Candidatus Omnitrophota bacterium]
MIANKSILKKHADYFKFSVFGKGIVALCSIKPKSYKSAHKISDREVERNRRWLCNVIGVDYKNLVYLHQVHGSRIYEVKLSHIKKSPVGDYDAVISRDKNIPLAVFSADCLPIFLADRKKSAIALIHAGWRSTLKGIAAKVVRRLESDFDICPGELRVGLGASLRKCCFEVSGDFLKKFPDSVIKKDNALYFDLVKENIRQLCSSGVKRSNIFDSGYCTSCDNGLFFSYRKEKDTCGRMISLMMLI